MAMQQALQGGAHEKTPRKTRADRIATGLGWFSIGLGVAEVVAPQRMAQLIGVKDEEHTRAVMRAYGLREIASGVGILSQSDPAGWLWGRVAGDLMDLASLRSAMKSNMSDRTRGATATAVVLGVTAVDVLCAQQLSRTAGQEQTEQDRAIQIVRTIIVSRSPEEVYQFWRDLQNLPKFMNRLESVQVTGERHSHFKAEGPGGSTIEWDSEIVDDQPGSLIAWRSLENSDINISGTVRFERAPGGRGALVRVELHHTPSVGLFRPAKLIKATLGLQIENDLRALKQIMEVGEIVRSESSIHPGIHSAQPSATV